VGSPVTTAVKVTGVANGAGDDTETETDTVIPFAAVCPIKANPATADRHQLRIPSIFSVLSRDDATKEAAFQNSQQYIFAIFAELFSE
jgi:hypothetical protein